MEGADNYHHLIEDILNKCLDNPYHEAIRECLEDTIKASKAASKDETHRVKGWMQWVKTVQQLKVVSTRVPAGIIINGRQCKLHDVRVFTKYGPDDDVYDKNKDIRDKIARGNCVLEIEDGTETGFLAAVYALKKFTGGLGDDDDRVSGNNHTWKRYFTKPIDTTERVVCTRKANGEAAHLSAIKIDKHLYMCGGSKNVHMLFRSKDDIRRYGEEQRYKVAREVCETVLDHISKMESKDKHRLLEFMWEFKLTGVFEILNPGHSHVEDLSHLTSPELRFITWTSNIIDPPGEVELCSMPPHVAIEVARALGLQTIDYEVILYNHVSERMAKVRRDYGYEGEVLYFLNADGKVIGLLKKKTIWYILCRAIREKLRGACSSYERNKSTFSLARSVNKVERRIEEIQRWLGLDEAATTSWKSLGVSCIQWGIKNLENGRLKMNDVADKFPCTWKEFLTETDQIDTIESSWDESSGSDD